MFYWRQLEEVGFHDPCSSQGFQALEEKENKRISQPLAVKQQEGKVFRARYFNLSQYFHS